MVSLPFGEPLTYDDLEGMPEDGHRYELLDGALLVSPSPGTAHQVCVGALLRVLHAARGEEHLVLPGPYDYVISRHTVLVPDVLVARRSDFTARNIGVPPLLVVEVLSPSSRRTDPGSKLLAYRDARVPAYWIVDPLAPSISVFHLEGEGYREVANAVADEELVTDQPFTLRIVPGRLLDDLEG